MAENIKHNVSYPFGRNVLESLKTSNYSAISGTGVGSSYSDYVFYNPTASQFQIGGSELHLGSNAGAISQQSFAVALGSQAGQTSQGTNSVAVGYRAGAGTQGENSVAIGSLAGQNIQSTQAVAIGYGTGQTSQGQYAVAIGALAGAGTQSTQAVAIGYGAGQTSQGQYAVAIGALAGQNTQFTGSIVINASGTALNSNQQGLYINPVRGTATATPVVVYNSSTKELTYNTSSRKYKENIEDLGLDTSVVLSLQPRQYTSKIDGKEYVGLVAEECYDVDPNFAWTENGQPEGIEWFNILLYTVAELKKLKVKVDQLSAPTSSLSPPPPDQTDI